MALSSLSSAAEWSNLVFDVEDSDEGKGPLTQTSFMHSAIRTLNLSIVLTLLSHGASLKSPVVDNFTPLDLLSSLNSDTLSPLRSLPPVLSFPSHRQWEVELSAVKPVYSCGRLSDGGASPADARRPDDDLSAPPSTHGNIYTFGKSDFTLGYPSSSSNSKPKRIHALRETNVVAVAAGAHHVAALTDDGKVLSWGHGKSGRLGGGDEQVRMVPTPVLGALNNRRVTDLSCSDVHTMACTSDGDVYAWGSNRYGQLGAPLSLSTKSSPRRVDGLKKASVVAVACAVKHSVALGSDGTVYCWGSNDAGQLGQAIVAGNALNPNPTAVSKLETFGSSQGSQMRAYAVDAGEECTCVMARKEGGIGCGISSPVAVFCFGYGDDSPRRIKFEPEKAAGDDDFPKPVTPVAISSAKHHTVCVAASGSVYVWGSHVDNLSVIPAKGAPSKPVLVPNLPPAVAVSACSTHTAVISRSGQVYTWGTTTRSGSLGVEGRKHISVPIKVEGVRRCVGVSVGQEHTVLLSAFGRPPLNPYDDVEDEEGEDLRFEAEEGLQDGGVELEEGDDLDTTLDTLDSSMEHHEPPPSTPRPLLSLQRQCEVTIARQVDTHNVIAILEKAASFFSTFLMDYCFDFLGNNLDGVLERLAGEKRRAEFEFLVDIITGGGGDDEMQEPLSPSLLGELPDTIKASAPRPADDFVVDWDLKESLIENHERVSKALRKEKKKGRRRGEQGETESLEKLLQRISDRMIYLGVKTEKSTKKTKEEGSPSVAPDKSKSDPPPIEKPRFYCNICNVEAPDEANLQIHIAGKRHRKAVLRMQSCADVTPVKKLPTKGWANKSTPSPPSTNTPTWAKSPPTPPPVSGIPLFHIPALPPSPLNFRELMEQQEKQKARDITIPRHTISPSALSSNSLSDPGSVSGSPPVSLSLSAYMKKGAAAANETPKKSKHVGSLGTLMQGPVVSPWKTEDKVKSKKTSFSDMLEEEKRVRENENTDAPAGHWFIERRQRGDSLEAIQLAEEEARQKRIQEEKAREEAKREEANKARKKRSRRRNPRKKSSEKATS